jgi:hypothetical protein
MHMKHVDRVWLLLWAAGAMAWQPATTAFAHHSFAMYDATQLVHIVGSVKELQWTNPHVILWVTRDAEASRESELWTIELPTSTGNLSRMNWSKHSLVAGDRVDVEINPLRDGHKGGSFKKATIQTTGQVLIASATPPPVAAGATTAADPAVVTTQVAPDGGAVAKPAAPPLADKGAAPAAPAGQAKQSGGCACSDVGNTPVHGALAVGWLAALLALVRPRPRPRSRSRPRSQGGG